MSVWIRLDNTFYSNEWISKLFGMIGFLNRCVIEKFHLDRSKVNLLVRKPYFSGLFKVQIVWRRINLSMCDTLALWV